jgi:carbon monoxide dehydrogenase subunit G
VWPVGGEVRTTSTPTRHPASRRAFIPGHAMILEAEFTVVGSPDTVFDTLADARRVVDAVPGARLTSGSATGVLDGDRGVEAELRLQAGSAQITYRGRVVPEVVDRAGGILACGIDAREARGTGAVRGRLGVRVTPAPDGTRLWVEARLEVTGRGESLGEERLRQAALRLLRRVAKRLGEPAVAAGEAASPPAVVEPPPAAPPAPAPRSEPPAAPPPADVPRPARAAGPDAAGRTVAGEVRLMSDRPVPLSRVPLAGTRLDDVVHVLRRRGWLLALLLTAAAALLVARARRRRLHG